MQSADSLKQLEANDYGRKVLYCIECDHIADDDFVELPHETKHNAVVKCCPHCYDTLTSRRLERIKTARNHTGSILTVDSNAPRSTVVRELLSPWGRMRMALSVHSFFSPFINLDGHVSPALKRLVDEEFSTEAKVKSFAELFAGSELNPIAQMSTFGSFLTRLARIIREIHLDPNAAEFIDLDPVTTATAVA